MNLIKSFFITLSTYSIIPVPVFDWEEKNMKYSLCFFPFIGLLCKILTDLWFWICKNAELNVFLFAAVATVIPIVLTGGIHLDGFMDTADALASHRERERKIEILKDPHIGAFSVIYLGVYLVLCFAVFYSGYIYDYIPIFTAVYVFSRALSALCAVNLPNLKSSSMLKAYTDTAKRKAVNIFSVIWVIFDVLYAADISFKLAGVMSVTGLVWCFLYYRTVMKNFGGVSGDTAGFFLQLCELFCMYGILFGAVL